MNKVICGKLCGWSLSIIIDCGWIYLVITVKYIAGVGKSFLGWF